MRCGVTCPRVFSRCSNTAGLRHDALAALSLSSTAILARPFRFWNKPTSFESPKNAEEVKQEELVNKYAHSVDEFRRLRFDFKPIDPTLSDLGRTIKDDFAAYREKYSKPKYAIVLAHGLMGFDELRLLGKWLPSIHYWRGIKEALSANNIEVVTTRVPTTSSIKERAEVLHEEIKKKAEGKDVNIIAHSMGGLDSRYLISRIQPKSFRVRSLTTIATPHRGSSAADMIFRELGSDRAISVLYRMMDQMKIESGAFTQLTRDYVCNKFNPCVPDHPAVRYFSYGASARPHLFSAFRISHDLMEVLEGPNDGLVSVASSRWGGEADSYKGTLMGVTHLDLINWTNRIKRIAARMALVKPEFNAVAFYLAIADMLAEEGL